jgi:P4 family phage/plasmid primase-like protien
MSTLSFPKCVNGDLLDQVKHAASGRWLEILERVGAVPADILDGKHYPCPKCGGTDRFSVFLDDSGGAICRKCFNTKNGDGIATLRWLTGDDFLTTVNRVADYLGITRTNGHAKPDLLTIVCRSKRMPIESAKTYGAHVAQRGKMDVVRFPVVNEAGEHHSHFDLSDDGGKGWFAKGNGKSGLFLPIVAGGRPRLPQAGETWIVCEGVKDAAGYHSIGRLACGTPSDQLAVKYARLFRDCNVVVMPDRKADAEAKALQSAARLFGVAASVRIGTLPLAIGGDKDDARDVLAMRDGETLLRRAIDDAAPWEPPKPKASAPPALSQPDGRTDAANARRLAAKHGMAVRWCDPWGKWLVWDGKRWVIDDQRRIDALAKGVANDLWTEAATIAPNSDRDTVQAMLSFARASNGANGVRNALTLARSESDIPILPGTLDTDPWLLNVANGTIDLRTGNTRQHSRSDYLTKLSPVVFDANADCPRWKQFLLEVFDGNKNLVRFIGRAAGYSITGHTSERCLFFLHGKGRNGKTTFVSTLQKMLGDYAVSITTEMLMVSKGRQHPTETCDLAGARMAVASETENGRKFAESFVKQITGGEDRIKGRRMREDFWQFDATHKLWISGNHKPDIRGTDDGIWDRIRLIPFNVRFAQPDKTLAATLESERSGILNWLIRGCLDWQSNGLGEPAEVVQATANYRAEMDEIGRFFGECCVIRDACEVGATPLFEAYKSWGGGLSQKAFKAELENRDGLSHGRFTSGPHKGRSSWKGVGLLASEG